MISLTHSRFGVVLAGAFVVLVAACGGGGGSGTKAPATRPIRVNDLHFQFMAPGNWTVSRTDRGISIVREKSPELVTVSTFPTVKPYRLSLFQEAIPEIDRAAQNYARQLKGMIVTSTTVRVSGRPVRQYVVEFGKLRERITFVFRNRTEYFLVCQWQGSDEPEACSQLTATFRLT